jgi:hypothetical protein
MRERKLRSGVNWRGALKQKQKKKKKSLQQTEVKRAGCE